MVAIGGIVVIAIAITAFLMLKRKCANSKDKLISPGFEMKDGVKGRRISIGDDLRKSMANM